MEIIAHTKSSKECQMTFLCRCETNLFHKPLKEGDVLLCLRCGTKWEKFGQSSVKIKPG